MATIPEHCQPGAARLPDAAVDELMRRIPEWRRDGDAIVRNLQVQDFRAALALVNAAGELAERENHHPDLSISGWNKVAIRLSTHDAGGLTLNDFVMARGIDEDIDGGAS